MEDYKEATYQAYLILNWRDGQIRLRMSTPNLMPYEVAIKIKVNVRVPRLAIPVIDVGTIEIPETKVEATEFEVEPLEEP